MKGFLIFDLLKYLNSPEYALQLYWKHISGWVFSYKFDAYFQSTFSLEHHWLAASNPLKFFRDLNWAWTNLCLFTCYKISSFSESLSRKKFHLNNITYRKVSWTKNLHLEKLVTRPMILTSYFNETKLFYSFNTNISLNFKYFFKTIFHVTLKNKMIAITT